MLRMCKVVFVCLITCILYKIVSYCIVYFEYIVYVSFRTIIPLLEVFGMDDQFAFARCSVQMLSRKLMLCRNLFGHALQVVRYRRRTAKEYADSFTFRIRFVSFRHRLQEDLFPIGSTGVEVIVGILFHQLRLTIYIEFGGSHHCFYQRLLVVIIVLRLFSRAVKFHRKQSRQSILDRWHQTFGSESHTGVVPINQNTLDGTNFGVALIIIAAATIEG